MNQIKRSIIVSSLLLKKMSNSVTAAAKNCSVAVCQMTATNNKEKNLETVKKLVAEASTKNAQVVFLPEACDFVGTSTKEINELAESLDGPLMNEYKQLALKHGVWISIGGFHEKSSSESKLKNAHVLINSEGLIASVYRKLHLFDVSLPEKNINLRETANVIGGKEIVSPCETPAGRLGLSICYDLRFPEKSILLRKMGAHILTFPSAFTKATGDAHWEVLLRARAIENQCYVIAAAQYGQHNSKRVSHGQAMIVDPWGKVVAECPKYSDQEPTNDSVAIANIDLDVLLKTRREMPVFEHRRNDIYKLEMIANNYTPFSIDYKFADKDIPRSTVFYETNFCFAFTNIRCVVPGHVLISSKRIAKRLTDLSPDELSDLFATAVKVQKVLENIYHADSSTICIQDGPNAGQTVPHVHIHVMPRRINDFENNDDIYLQLAKHDKDNSAQVFRSLKEMTDEANTLRQHLINI